VEWFALIGGLIAAVVLAALVGWLGFRAYEVRERETQRCRSTRQPLHRE
jgi:predicted negative regulator of RcsB-dependent stress response